MITLLPWNINAEKVLKQETKRKKDAVPYISSSLKRPYTTSLHVCIHTYIHTTNTLARPHVLSFFVVFIIVLLARKSLPAMCVK